MRARFPFHRIALAATAAIAAVVLSACGAPSTGSAGPPRDAADTTDQTADSGAMPEMTHSAADTNASFNEADVAFAQMMIPDHEMMAKMAALAKQKASSKDLKKLGEEMFDQRKPIAKLRGWLKAWGKSEDSGMTMPGAMTDKDMTMLKSMKGMQFDMMYAQMMIKYQEGSIQMAKDEQAKGSNSAAKAMAAAMVRNEQDEVERLRKISSM